MIRRVRRKTAIARDKPFAIDIEVKESFQECIDHSISEDVESVENEQRADWTCMPDDTLVGLFGLLNYRDRASLASVCKTWRFLASSSCLWTTLDLRAHILDADMASSLAGRCKKLQRLKFRGAGPAGAIVGLQARALRYLTGEGCRDLTDATLSMLAARHEALQSLQLGPDCERLTSDAIVVVAVCCPKLKRLRLSGVRGVDGEAIGALVKHCPNLTELGFLDCGAVDEAALGTATSVRFLSVAGSRNLSWNDAAHSWSKLPNLIALDASRTDITPASASRLLAAPHLKVLCALSCQILEEGSDSVICSTKSKVLLTRFTDIVKGLACLSPQLPTSDFGSSTGKTGLSDSLLGWKQRWGVKQEDSSCIEITEWVEWVLSHALLRVAESNTPGLDSFWLTQGTTVMLSLLKSKQEDVQERGATALATFVVIDDENATVDKSRAEAVMHGGGIASLLDLAKSCREGVQSESAKVKFRILKSLIISNKGLIRLLSQTLYGVPLLVAMEEQVMLTLDEWPASESSIEPILNCMQHCLQAIANLSVNAEVAKTVATEGGIRILAALARSRNRWVAEEAAGGLWNLSVGEEHKGAIAEAGAIEALVELAFKWPSPPSGGEGVLERAAGALANLAADDKCSMEVASAGGVHALVMLARFCKHDGVQEQAARALANLAAHGDSNGNNAAVGREAGSLEALVQLTCSSHEGVRQEAAGALWNLSFDDRNREAIAAAGGVEALVALAQSCSNGSQGLQERAAGALWGLSVSEANSIAIGREGGVAPLIALARSDSEDVHETAAGALWNLAFNPGNALRIVEEEGVPALVHLCSSSHSKMARFMAALALAYMFDGRMDDVAAGAILCENNAKGGGLDGARRMAMRNIDAFVQDFSNQQSLQAAASSWAPNTLLQVAESARIQEAGHLRCSGAEVGRFVAMLKNGSGVLRACAAFALLQFTMPGGRHAMHHASLLQRAGAGRVLRTVAAASTATLQAKVFARIVLRNLEQCPSEVHQLLL